MALDRYTLERRDLDGLLLGFGAFDPAQIRAGVRRLAAALAAARDGKRRPANDHDAPRFPRHSA